MVLQREWHAAATMAKRQGVSIDEFQEGIKGAHIPDLAENRQLFGSAQQPGPLHRSVSRLASFLIRHGLAKSTASAGDLFHPEIVDSD